MATYVLVPGAYQGGWIWKPVVDRLRASGHRVYAPTLDGCAERHHLVRPGITAATHAQEVAQLLFYEDLDRVVLVGTSSGGMVICKAAELARDRIARLVFVDALAPMSGEKVGDIVKRVAANETTAITTGPARADAEQRLVADVEREATEPVFHAAWEGRVFGLTRACSVQHLFNIDESRHGIERMAPIDYLASSYYERWLDRNVRLLVEKGVITHEELERRMAQLAGGAHPAPPPSHPQLLERLLRAPRGRTHYPQPRPPPRLAARDFVPPPP